LTTVVPEGVKATGIVVLINAAVDVAVLAGAPPVDEDGEAGRAAVAEGRAALREDKADEVGGSAPSSMTVKLHVLA
jgi:hypothetical protein